MFQKELIQRLAEEDIPSYTYCFDKEYPNEAHCLIKKNGKWQVYYSERGTKTGLKEFSTEEEACNYFYNDLISVLRSMGLL